MAITKTASTKTAAKVAPDKDEVKKTAAKVEMKETTKAAVKAEAKVTAKQAPAKAEPVKADTPAKTEPKVTKVDPKKTAESAPKAKAAKAKKVPYESNGEVKVELVHSTASCTKRQIRTVQALGLKKLHDTKIHKDNPAIRGMCNLVAHLVTVEKVK